MKIVFHRRFEKNFRKLSSGIQKKVYMIIVRFEKNPFDDRLRNHALRGSQEGRRAISVTDDIRIIYEPIDQHQVLYFLDIGTRDQVYE